MVGIRGQYELEIQVDGKNLHLDSSLLNHFYVINNIHQHLPSINMMFKDVTGKVINSLPKEGAKISVNMGTGDKMHPSMNFVTMGAPKVNPTATYVNIGLNGVLDNIQFLKKVVNKNYKGTAADAISKLAGEVGLSVDVDITNDFMNWLPNSTTISQFTNHIMDRSFSSASSAMVKAVTDTGILRFKDLEKIISNGPSLEFSFDNPNMPVLSWTCTPKSAVGNSSQGYGATSIGMKEDGSFFEGNKIQMTLMSGLNSVASTFQSAIGDLGSRINYLAPLSGNTHEKWNEALHQNPRIKSTYAFDVEMITNVVSGVKLLDLVKFRGLDPISNGEAKALTGNYIVTASTKFIHQNRYLEKIILTSNAPGGV